MNDHVKTVLSEIEKLHRAKEHIIIAIDGRCASGKTTFAHSLKERIDCNVFHVDDFFLRPEQRTEERLKMPGGNFDKERMLEEVMVPLSQNKGVEYSPFDCCTCCLKNKFTVPYKSINIIEGSYSCHPDLFDYYDLHIFLDIDKDTQEKRLIDRSGLDMFSTFKNLWIPLEEKYFNDLKIKDKCELVFVN